MKLRNLLRVVIPRVMTVTRGSGGKTDLITVSRTGINGFSFLKFLNNVL